MARRKTASERWQRAGRQCLTLSWTIDARTLDEVSASVADAHARGFRNFNVKVGSDATFDVQMCREIRRLAPEAFVWVGSGAGLKIGVAGDGTVLVKTSSNSVFVRIGSANGIGTGWQLLASTTTADGAVWFLGADGNATDFNIYRWPANGVPVMLEGAATRISLATDGTVLVKNSYGSAYARIGSTNGIGIGWQALASTLTADSATWLLGPDGVGNDLNIYRWAAIGAPAQVIGFASRIGLAGDDNRAIIWEAATGKRAVPPLAHRAYVFTAAFSPDSRFLVTASADHTARVWEVRTGEAISPPLPHGGPVPTAVWTKDGRRVVTGCDDGRVRSFDLPPSDALPSAFQRQAELLSAHRLESNGGVVPLTADEMRERWQSRLRNPGGVLHE